MTSAELATKTRDELRALPAVADALRDAEMQLAQYRQTLDATGGPLKLCAHAVVCIGLEQLVFASYGAG